MQKVNTSPNAIGIFFGIDMYCGHNNVFLLFVCFYAGDAEAVSTCQSGTLTGILGSILFCTLLVIIVLVLKICWSKGKENTSKKSLWTEKISLNTKPSAED